MWETKRKALGIGRAERDTVGVMCARGVNQGEDELKRKES